MVTRHTVVLTSQYTQVSDHYTAHLKLAYCMSFIPRLKYMHIK